jgi:hypothetical protein
MPHSPTSTPPLRLPPDAPPLDFVPWPEWYRATAATWKQGQHRLFVGPTQSGKTLLARMHARMRRYVVVLGTKPVDPSLDEYLAEGYERTEVWPPPRKLLTPDRNGDVRLILWPKIKARADLRRHRQQYQRFLDHAFINGRWTIVADEGLWLASRTGLNLGSELGDIAYGSASNGVNLCLLIQRPAGIPRVTWSSVSDAMVFHSGVTNDTRELASLGTIDPKAVTMAIRQLQGHDFLALPCRGGATWATSRVDLADTPPLR